MLHAFLSALIAGFGLTIGFLCGISVFFSMVAGISIVKEVVRHARRG